MFTPKFTISPILAQKLVKIERLANELRYFKIQPNVLAGLRETAKIHTVHYSTFIEGNRLTMAEVQTVLHKSEHSVGQERDEGEVRGYYFALNQVADWVEADLDITENRIQRLHALVMAEGRLSNVPTPYREVQNVIRNARTNSITYMPPEAADVADLMSDLCHWLVGDTPAELPVPIVAGLLHYQFVTIHPYLDGNGRTARLLTTWQMHKSGYDLGGIYSLEEHYAKNLVVYYASLSLGPSHNYYFGREHADLTPWLEYFVDGTLKSFSAVSKQVKQITQPSAAIPVPSKIYLDLRKRTVLEHFPENGLIKSKDLENLFGIGSRAARNLAQKWSEEGFFTIENPSRKGRLYRIIYVGRD